MRAPQTVKRRMAVLRVQSMTQNSTSHVINKLQNFVGFDANVLLLTSCKSKTSHSEKWFCNTLVDSFAFKIELQYCKSEDLLLRVKF